MMDRVQIDDVLEHFQDLALARDVGLRVTSLCRGGMFPAATAAERLERIDDNRRAIDDAAALGAPVLVLVCGAAPDRDIGAARTMVADGIAAIASHARAAGVRLGIEPLHPAFAADRSCITTLREARLLAERFDSRLGANALVPTARKLARISASSSPRRISSLPAYYSSRKA